VLESRLEELRALYETQLLANRVASQITEEEINRVTAELTDMRKRAAELKIHAATPGVFVAPGAHELLGRFLRRGELVGYVLESSSIIARVVVSQADVDFVRRQTRDVRIRFPDGVSEILPASLVREVPAATDQLPSRTLSREGGGEIAIDPREMRGTKTLENIFLFDIQLPPPAGYYNVGGRVYVRFDHGEEPVIWRWYRGMRALFLKKFNV
jgi:putative peptide zinc metalloprotease protein